MTAAENLQNEARVETLRMTITKALAVRRVPLSEMGRARLDGCTDPKVLERWYERSLTAETEHDVFVV